MSNGTTDAHDAMIALLKSKRAAAQLFHGAITADNATLNELFAAEDYTAILEFLESGTSVRAPVSGQPLVIPGKPRESALYAQITRSDGRMYSRFSSDEVATVRRWIEQLPAIAPPIVALRSRRVATGLANPLFATAPVTDARRLFIVGQTGDIRILDLTNGQLLPTPFLTITNLMTAGSEQGLLGLAFHPQYASNGRFFVNLTVPGGPGGRTEIREYRVSNNPDLADPASARVILSFAQPFQNHNGGWIAFGPDQFLYIATGDGGSGNDPDNRAQRLDTQLGKLLRIDIDADDFPTDPRKNYAIPGSNPFVGLTAAEPEIWAFGLRNPWRCSFDRMTGDLYIGDVGQNTREEINFQPASSMGGENYGWRLREGTIANPAPGVGGPRPIGAVDPIHDYDHNHGFTVIGGFVYRGTTIPSLRGTYLFADFGGRVWSFETAGSSISNLTERTAELAPSVGTLAGISSFGEDATGNLYIISRFGDVFQIE